MGLQRVGHDFKNKQQQQQQLYIYIYIYLFIYLFMQEVKTRITIFKYKKLCNTSNINVTCMHAFLLQSCLTPCNPMDCSPPGSSVYGFLQARILEWVVISFSREKRCHTLHQKRNKTVDNLQNRKNKLIN